MDLQLKGRRVLVTGSTRGIGRVMAEQFAAEGADVAICGRDADNVARAIKDIAATFGVKVTGEAVDVGNGEAIRAWIPRAAEALGGLDIVVSNVSAGGGGRTAIEAWRQNFEVDMLGAVHTVEAALPFLEAAGQGSIVMISSTAGLETFRAPTPYNVFKAGLINYAKNLSQVLAPKNIRVNTVAPGPVKFPGGAWERIERENKALHDDMLSQIPLGRMGHAEDIASAVVYLSSPLAGYITGSNLVIDGGFTKRVNFDVTGRLANRTALVTGAAEGIGLAIAARLAADGARVVLADVQDAKGAAAAAGIGATYRRCDVSSEADWAALADIDGLDILVNNAGINPPGQDLASLDLATWRRVQSINLDGVFLGCRFALNAMAAAGGSIVNIASAGALRPNVAYPAYAASKAAVCTLTRSVALYCGDKGLAIRCNAVLPGSVETPLVERLRESGGDAGAARARAAAKHPIGFVGAPEDIAGAVAFLVSDDARFVTGALMAVDGGMSI